MSKRETWKKKIKELLARGKMTEKALRKSVGIEEKKKFHQVLDELVEEGSVRVNREHVVELIEESHKKKVSLFLCPEGCVCSGTGNGSGSVYSQQCLERRSVGR